MSTSRLFDRICVLVTVAAMLLTILFMNGQALGLELVTDADSEAYSDNTYFTDNDQTADWDTSSATVITLEGDHAAINGSNAYEYDGNVVIAGSGRFVVTGTLDDGYLSVAANANSKVWILFQGVDITCSDNACLRVEEADKVFLTLAEGTQNSLTDGEELSEEAEEDGSYGVIFSHDDLTINGNGALSIAAGYKHGIKANDDLVITGGSITIDAPADGIHVNDSFRLKEADLTITAGDDAVHADGGVSISDGTILINSCYEGIEALTIDVLGGEITIYPTNDGFNANGGTGDTWIHISGGTITIINENGNDADGLDSNGDICISGGTVRISLTNNGTNSAIDAATENGGSAQITGGTMIACGSYSMAEGFDSSSTQCSVLYNISSGAEAGTDLSVETEDGTLLLAWEVPCSFSSAIVSCPEMTLDETYTITAGDLEESVTLTETTASAGDAQSNMAGGNMNHGGMLQAGGMGAMDGMPERPDAAAGTEQESTDHQAEDGTASAQSVSTAENGQEGGPMQGERPEGQNGPQEFGGGPGMQAESTASETAQITEGTSALSYDRSVYVLLAASFLVLILGLAAAICYRK